MNKYNVIVLGAGYAGLSCAALTAQKSQKTLLLESHSDIGGCAGRFKRKDFLYDAGATTLSGIAHNGPLSKLIKQLELNPKLYSVEPSLVIQSLSGRQVKRYRKLESWISELEKHFPDIAHKSTWQKIDDINKKSWALLPVLKNFPPQNLKQALALITPQTLKASPLLPLLNTPFSQLLDPKAQHNSEYMALMNEMLMISTQSRADEVNALIGSLGASYLGDTWLPHGGMTALGDQILERYQQFGGEFQTRTKVKRIEAQDGLWKIITQKEEVYICDKLISSLPMWNHKELGPPGLKTQIKDLEKAHPKAWGAVTAYTGISFEKTLPTNYFQIHTQEIPFSEGESVFISLSHLEDELRAPPGQHALSASIHTHEKHWPHPRGTDEYKAQKKKLDKAFQKVFEQTFSKYGYKLEGKLEIGTPHTFERYTSRFKGRVGGLPHKRLKTLWNYPSSLTSLKSFYRIGDTVFPGQGVVGVISGAQKLVEYLEEVGEI